MLTILIIGTTPPCAVCRRAEQEALKAAEQFAGQVQVKKLDALSPEAETFGLSATPTTILGGEILATGRVLRAEALVDRIREALSAATPQE